MRHYRADCDTCGPIGPERVRRGNAERDVRNHDCQTFGRAELGQHVGPHVTDDPQGVMLLARKAVSAYLRVMPSAAYEQDEMLSDALFGAAGALQRFDPA